jgi:hypothetical protein
MSMNMGDQHDVSAVHALEDSLRLANEALRKIATYSPRGSLNPDGPIPIGALSQDIRKLQSMARSALIEQGRP